MNKQNLARWNRWLGWAFVVVTIFSVVTAYPRDNALVPLDPKGALYQTVNFALIPSRFTTLLNDSWSVPCQ